MHTQITFKEYQEYIKMLKMDKSSHTIRSYIHIIDKFLNHFNIDHINNIKTLTSTDFRDYQSFLLENGLSQSSVNGHFRPIKAFINFLVENEYIDKSPLKIKSLKSPKKLPKFLSDNEIELMIHACRRTSDKLIFILMFTTGLRRNELVTLRLNDLKDGRISIKGKGDRERNLLLPLGVNTLLESYIVERISKWGTEKYDTIFLSQIGEPFTGDAIYAKIKSIATKAGFSEQRVKEITPHVLRHTFATNMVSCGADIRVVQGALGHQNLETTQIYAHLKSSALDAAMMRLPSFTGGE